MDLRPLKKLRRYWQRVGLYRRGVRVDPTCEIWNVEFQGTAEIGAYSRLFGEPRIVIGKDFYCNANCHFLGEISIGESVQIGPKTVIWGRDHGMLRGQPMRVQPHKPLPIAIGDDVWIGASVVILKGVSIGDGAVVAAGAIVVRDVEPYAVVAGNPARKIKSREPVSG